MKSFSSCRSVYLEAIKWKAILDNGKKGCDVTIKCNALTCQMTVPTIINGV